MNKKKLIVIIIFVSLILGGVLFVIYQRENRPNPVIVELQKQITAQVGPEFEISDKCYDYKNPISMVIIEGEYDQFKEEQIFTKVNKIREIVYAYVFEHEEDFSLKEKYPNGNGLTLHIGNSLDPEIFTFSNYIDNEEIFSEDYVSVRCWSRNDRGDRSDYAYKCSQLKALKNVKELEAYYFEIDDVKVLGQMEGLEYFFANIEDAKSEEDYEELNKAVNAQGIKFGPWE